MTIDIADLRKGVRFNFQEAVEGTFGPADITTVNISLTGIQIAHAHPLRIGTHGRVQFRRGDVHVAVQAQVVWSHLGQNDGGMAYRSGLKFDTVDAALAAAINALYRSGVVVQDRDSLEKKRQRLLEREIERAKASRTKSIPTSAPIESS